jgi:Uma2 family endonuclease
MSFAARVTKKPKAAAPLPPAIPPFPIRRFTLDEYHKMLEVGVLKHRDPYELLNGMIVAKMSQNSPHASASSRLERRLAKLLPDAWVMRSGKPISIPGSDSEPEPDIAVASGPEDKYDSRHPAPKEVVLVVEVSDTSLGRDAGEKHGIYAGAKISEYWIINVNERRVEVYTEPRGGKNPAYKKHVDCGPEDAVPVVVAGKELGRISIKELLP